MGAQAFMKWNHIFDIKEDWKKAEVRVISVGDFGRLIAGRISSSSFYRQDLKEIVDKLNDFDDGDWDDFDVVWDSFYDWCDCNKVWIRIF